MMSSWVSALDFSFEVVMMVMIGLIFQIADQSVLSWHPVQCPVHCLPQDFTVFFSYWGVKIKVLLPPLYGKRVMKSRWSTVDNQLVLLTQLWVWVLQQVKDFSKTVLRWLFVWNTCHLWGFIKLVRCACLCSSNMGEDLHQGFRALFLKLTLFYIDKIK